MPDIQEAQRRVKRCLKNGETELDLYGFGIYDIEKEIPQLKACVQLTQLDLRSNQLSDISALSGLNQITYLNLDSNQLSDISALSGLTQLTQLDLRSNQLSDISALSGLTQLTQLYLAQNQLSDISTLSDLTQLTQLDLRSNQLSDISALSGLNQITYLTLSKNRISDISAISGLTQLTHLYLAENQLSDISALSGLTQLTQLLLLNNRIEEFRPLLLFQAYRSRLLKVYVTGNPDPLLNQAAGDGYEALKVYYDSQAIEGVVLNDYLKVIMLGNSTTGKTSLLNYLGQKDFDEQEVSTHGIARVMDFPLSSDETGHVNFWDFGGQDYYHATHRLFITSRSLCIVVCHQDLENRREEEDTIEHVRIIENGIECKVAIPVRVKHYPYSYWLKTFAHLTKAEGGGGRASVFLVENKCFARQGKRDMHLPEEALNNLPFTIVNEDFFHLDIRETYRFEQNIERNEDTETYHVAFKKFEKVLKAELTRSFRDNSFAVHANYPVIRDLIAELADELQGDALYQHIERLKAELKIPSEHAYEKLPVWLSYDEYLGIIRQNSKVVNEQTIGFITTYLRDFCGRILYFEDVASLRNIVFIDPQWLHTRIYRFLNKDFVRERTITWQGQPLHLKQGEFTLDEVDEAFEGDYLDAVQLLDLMQAFELVFEIPEQTPRRFVAPPYLPLVWPLPQIPMETFTETLYQRSLTLEFGQYLPPSLISRIIAQKGQLIKKTGVLWRNGLIYVENDQSIFLLCTPEENKIEVYLNTNDQTKRQNALRDFVVFMEDKYADELENALVSLPHINGKPKWKHLVKGKKEGWTIVKDFRGSDVEGVNLDAFRFLIRDFERKPINVFVCYSHGDSAEMKLFVEPLQKELRSIGEQHNLSINDFTDLELKTGDLWHTVLQENITKNDLLICLVSPTFFTSPYIQQHEYGKVMRDIAADNSKAVIAPVFIKPCTIVNTNPIANLQFFKPGSERFGLGTIEHFAFSNLIDKDKTLIHNYVTAFVKGMEDKIVKIWKERGVT